MARKPTPDAHERILDAAAGLFDRYGVHAVGMQQIIDEFGCGKNLLYREFASKDDLVVAYLRRCSQDWDGTVAQARSATDDPAGQLLELVRLVGEKSIVPGTRGCPLRNTYAEFPDPEHPAHQISIDHFTGVREQLNEIARRTDAAEPSRLADRIMFIIDGLYTNGPIFGRDGVASALAFARDVLRAETSAKLLQHG
jgi:AcrR family transcriptional regulator